MSRMNTVDLGAVADASDDARLLGAGYLRILPDGTMERLDPRYVILKAKPKEPETWEARHGWDEHG